MKEQWRFPTGVAVADAFNAFVRQNVELQFEVVSKADADAVSDFLPAMVLGLRNEVTNKR